jgi:hypothetical protein
MKRVDIFLTSLFAAINVYRESEPVQICHIEPALHSDACVAVKTVKSQHERGHNLLMTFSVKFHQRSGWAAFGVGDILDRALMFALWPGEQEGGNLLNHPILLEGGTDIARYCYVVTLDNRTPPSTSTQEPETGSRSQHGN